MANFNWSLSTIWFLYQEKRSQRARRGAFGSLRIYIGISTNTAKWAKSTKIHANAVYNHKRRIFTDLFGVIGCCWLDGWWVKNGVNHFQRFISVPFWDTIRHRTRRALQEHLLLFSTKKKIIW